MHIYIHYKRKRERGREGGGGREGGRVGGREEREVIYTSGAWYYVPPLGKNFTSGYVSCPKGITTYESLELRAQPPKKGKFDHNAILQA